MLNNHRVSRGWIGSNNLIQNKLSSSSKKDVEVDSLYIVQSVGLSLAIHEICHILDGDDWD